MACPYTPPVRAMYWSAGFTGAARMPTRISPHSSAGGRASWVSLTTSVLGPALSQRACRLARPWGGLCVRGWEPGSLAEKLGEDVQGVPCRRWP